MDAIRRKAEKYAEADITSAVIYGCHFRWDYMPYFILLNDYLATVAETFAKAGYAVIITSRDGGSGLLHGRHSPRHLPKIGKCQPPH